MNNKEYRIRFEAYLLTEKRASAQTVSAYKRDVEHLDHFLNVRTLTYAQATNADLKEFLEILYKKQLKASTRARKIAAIKALYRFLYEHYGIPNTAQELCIPKQDQPLPRYLSHKEMQTLFASAAQDSSFYGKRNALMLQLLYATGIRATELVSLKLDDLHFDATTIRVMGKGGKQRLIPISEQVLTSLKEYVKIVHPQVIQNVDKKILKTNYLFPHKNGGVIKPLTRQTLWGVIRRLCVDAGIKRVVSPHQLRHTLATHLLGEGADLRSLQLLLGHENISTVQIYTHLETKALRSVYNKKHPRSES